MAGSVGLVAWACPNWAESDPLRPAAYNVGNSRRPLRAISVSTDAGQSADTNIEKAGDLRAAVEPILEMIRPAVQMDGGDVELIDVTDDGVVRVRLHGACIGCPSSAITLKSGIERTLRENVPGVTGVEAVD